MKSTLHILYISPRVPNFRPFVSTSSRTAVYKISHILGFPLDSHVKISKCHKIFIFWQLANSFINLHSTMTALFVIKFGSDRVKAGQSKRSSILKFLAPHGPVLTKISKCHKMFTLWQITKKVTAYIPS